jgi:hypothetical protein
MNRCFRITTFISICVSMMILCGSATARAQEVWFGPLLPRAPSTHIRGAVDWPGFLKSRAGWERSSTRVAVLKVSRGYLFDAPDDELTEMASRLAALGIALGIEIQPIAVQESDHCGHHEGYDHPKNVAFVVNKLARLHIKPKYVAFDEPVWFGHFATDPQTCQFPILDVAGRVVTVARLYKAAFPDVVFGDIETLGPLVRHADWQNAFQTYVQAFNQAIGAPLQFVQLDLDWRNPGWPEQITAFRTLGRTLGLKLGVIYNGDGEDTNDAQWIAHAQQNVALTETLHGIVPEQAVFQSWNKYPTHALPENSPSAHTWLIAQYSLTPAHFLVAQNDSHREARLLGPDGSPVANAPVELQRKGSDPAQMPQERTVSGTVPDNAHFALVGLHVNADCFCAGSNDLIIGPFAYTEHRDGAARQNFDLTVDAQRILTTRGNGGEIHPLRVADNPLARIKVAPNQHLLLDSPQFAVTPGSNFTFSARLGSVTGAGLFGNATIAWAGADKHVFSRVNIRMERDDHPVASLRTDSTGRFAIPALTDSTGKQVALSLHFAGNETFREAYADLP